MSETTPTGYGMPTEPGIPAGHGMPTGRGIPPEPGSTPRAKERIRSLPEFRRAREYRLYTGDGRRFLDFWADDGHAVTGHRGRRWRETLSNKLSRGLAMPVPGPEAEKLRRAIRTWLAWEFASGGGSASGAESGPAGGSASTDWGAPAGGSASAGDRPVYIFRNEAALFTALSNAIGGLPLRDSVGEPNGNESVTTQPLPSGNGPVTKQPLPKGNGPVTTPPSPSGSSQGEPSSSEPSLVRLRAFSRPHVQPCDWIIPVLPLPGCLAPVCLVGPEGTQDDDRIDEEIQSPAILAACARAVYDVCGMFREGSHPGAALAEQLSTVGVWKSRGPWLIPATGNDEAAYDRLFNEYLKRGIVLNPAAGEPSIVPAVLSKGERSRIREATEEVARRGVEQ